MTKPVELLLVNPKKPKKPTPMPPRCPRCGLHRVLNGVTDDTDTGDLERSMLPAAIGAIDAWHPYCSVSRADWDRFTPTPKANLRALERRRQRDAKKAAGEARGRVYLAKPPRGSPEWQRRLEVAEAEVRLFAPRFPPGSVVRAKSNLRLSWVVEDVRVWFRTRGRAPMACVYGHNQNRVHPAAFPLAHPTQLEIVTTQEQP